MAMDSSNIVSKSTINMGIYGLHSAMGANKRFLHIPFIGELASSSTSVHKFRFDNLFWLSERHILISSLW